MNRITLIGRLSNDPEIRQTQSGLSVCSFTVAVNNGKDKDGNERNQPMIIVMSALFDEDSFEQADGDIPF